MVLAGELVQKQHNVVFFGDSHMQLGNWQKLLQRCDVANLGIGGQTSAEILERIEQVFHHWPQVCYIEAGANDIYHNISYATYISNIIEIWQQLKKEGITPVQFPILHVAKWYSSVDNMNVKINRYNKGLDSIAKEYKIEVMNINSTLPPDGILKTEYAQPDGIHLNEDGYTAWCTIIQNTR